MAVTDLDARWVCCGRSFPSGSSYSVHRGHHKRVREPFVERFASRVARNAGCWTWTGRRTSKGYGQFGASYAHRIAWELAHGPIPPGLLVLHHCDNPPCVKTEPDDQWPDGHLFLGTVKDNSLDMVAKGREFHQQHPERVIRGDAHYLRRDPEKARASAAAMRARKAEKAAGR